jgi:hypothetical protein
VPIVDINGITSLITGLQAAENLVDIKVFFFHSAGGGKGDIAGQRLGRGEDRDAAQQEKGQQKT